MFFASRIACSGIVFLLMTPWVSGPHSSRVDSGTNLSDAMPGETNWKDAKEMQQTLQDAGHYRGQVDGVLGLKTRASIRRFQKAENLPVTGQLDVQTANKLGVRPAVREATSDESRMDKPSAGIERARSSTRSRKTLLKPVKKVARIVPPA